MALAQTTTLGPWEQVGNYGPDPFYATGSTSYTSGTFNAAANSILVITVAITGAGNHTVSSITNSGTGLTWNRVIRRTATADASGVGAQNEEIWYALNTSSQTGITYTLTWTENTDNYTGFARGHLRVFTGYNSSTIFSSSASYSGAYNGGKPQLSTAVTQTTGGVVVGVFADGNDSGTLSSTTADTTGGVLNTSGTINTGYFIRGLSDSLSAGSFQPSMNTDETNYTFTGVFAVLAAGESTIAAAASETATGVSAATLTRPLAGAPSITASATAVAGNVLTALGAPSITASGAADASVITTHNAEAASIIAIGSTDTLALTQGMVAASTITATATAVGATNTAANGAVQAIGAARAVIAGETSPGFLYATVAKNILTN